MAVEMEHAGTGTSGNRSWMMKVFGRYESNGAAIDAISNAFGSSGPMYDVWGWGKKYIGCHKKTGLEKSIEAARNCPRHST